MFPRYGWFKRSGPADDSPRRLVVAMDGNVFSIPEVGGYYYLAIGRGEARRVLIDISHAAARLIVETSPLDRRDLKNELFTLREPAKGRPMSATDLDEARRTAEVSPNAKPDREAI